MPDKPAKLALEDGTVFTGRHFGTAGTRTGEVVFTTSMTGYQEILTDPSYAGQIITMTYPLIGNYGINIEDLESVKPACAGFIVKELAGRESNFRSTGNLNDWLVKHDVVGTEGLDTRALTRKLRVQGAMNGCLSSEILDDAELLKIARSAPKMLGLNLVDTVAPADACTWPRASPALSLSSAPQAGTVTTLPPSTAAPNTISSVTSSRPAARSPSYLPVGQPSRSSNSTPTACSSLTVLAIPVPSFTRPTSWQASSEKSPSSASAWGTNCWDWPSAASGSN